MQRGGRSKWCWWCWLGWCRWGVRLLGMCELISVPLLVASHWPVEEGTSGEENRATPSRS